MLQLQQKGDILMIHILEKHPLFAGLDEQAVNTMITCHKPVIKTYDHGEVIFFEGESLDSFGIVIAGSIHLIKADYFGNETIIKRMKTGDSFGEAIALQNHAKTRVRVVTAQKTTVAFFAINDFLTMCNTPCTAHQRVHQNLMQMLASKLIDLQDKLDVLSKRSIRDKVLDYLMQRHQETGDALINVEFTRQELADYLRVNRSALGRELKHMQEEGIIRIDRNAFLLRHGYER